MFFDFSSLCHRIAILTLSIFSLFPIPASAEKSPSYQEVEWTALIPQDDLEILLNPPDALYDIADGPAQDDIDVLQNSEQADEETKRYLEALSSSRVVEGYAGKTIRIPGFVVPLSSGDDHKITEFFIVPYFGACLHMPPPPPNQIIYSTSQQGIELNNLYEPFWFEGTLVIEQQQNSVASSAYTLKLDNVLIYDEE